MKKISEPLELSVGVDEKLVKIGGAYYDRGFEGSHDLIRSILGAIARMEENDQIMTSVYMEFTTKDAPRKPEKE